ncbi:MAG: PIN domain-containing protein [Actinobacteria bacterium]|nr:PIN domain-containing protein [Actinomycetota bacterium]
MKIFFDTSVIIAAFVGAHPRHEDSLPWLQKVKKKEVEGVISVHSLIETYSILTTLPLSPRINPVLARDLIKENIINDFKLVTYNIKDCKNLIETLSRRNISGGASYEGLILAAAKKSGVEKILTLNANDFVRIFPELSGIVHEP